MQELVTRHNVNQHKANEVLLYVQLNVLRPLLQLVTFPYQYAGSDADSRPRTDEHADGDTHACSNEHFDPDRYAYAYTDKHSGTNRHFDADSRSQPYKNPVTDSYPGVNVRSRAHGVFRPNGCSGSQPCPGQTPGLGWIAHGHGRAGKVVQHRTEGGRRDVR